MAARMWDGRAELSRPRPSAPRAHARRDIEGTGTQLPTVVDGNAARAAERACIMRRTDGAA